MRRTTPLAVVFALVLGLITGPAAADHEPCLDELERPVTSELVQWVKAPDQRLGNAAAFGHGTYPTWNGDKPTQSVTAGAGGASLQHRAGNASGGSYDPELAGRFEGTYTGCLDMLAFDLYLLSPLAPIGGKVTTVMQLTIDGVHVYTTPEDPAAAVNAPAEGTTGRLFRLKFAFTEIDAVLRAAGGIDLEGEHTVTLTAYSQYINDAQGAYVYDTTEAPSHVTFNKRDMSAYTVLLANG